MILAIAIIGLIGLILGMVSQIKINASRPLPFLCLSTITILAWWNICLPFAIILICYGAIWAIIAIFVALDN